VTRPDSQEPDQTEQKQQKKKHHQTQTETLFPASKPHSDHKKAKQNKHCEQKKEAENMSGVCDGGTKNKTRTKTNNMERQAETGWGHCLARSLQKIWKPKHRSGNFFEIKFFTHFKIQRYEVAQFFGLVLSKHVCKRHSCRLLFDTN